MARVAKNNLPAKHKEKQRSRIQIATKLSGEAVWEIQSFQLTGLQTEGVVHWLLTSS